MNGGRNRDAVRVVKRDGSSEAFDPPKLAASMWRWMREAGQGRFSDAADLAQAIRMYLVRAGGRRVSSAAVFEMTVKVLRTVKLPQAADLMESARRARADRRRRCRMRLKNGETVAWDKNLMVRRAMAGMGLSRSVARILAGFVEREILARDAGVYPMARLMDRMHSLAEEFGLVWAGAAARK